MNKFDNWALLLAGENHQKPFKYSQPANNPGLPKEANRDLNNIHLITCSNKVPCMELVEGFIHDLTQLETEGMVMYDSHLKTDVLVRAPVIMAICDNPRASEMLSHMGGTANKYCRMCMVSKSVRSMLHNYGALTSQCDKTVNPTSIAKERTKTSSMTQTSLIKQAEGSRKQSLQTKYGLHDRYNPLFQLSVDFFRYRYLMVTNNILFEMSTHRSTPIECLHTILLGGYKYLFRELMDKLSPTQKQEVCASIDHFPHSGLHPHHWQHNQIQPVVCGERV